MFDNICFFFCISHYLFKIIEIRKLSIIHAKKITFTVFGGGINAGEKTQTLLLFIVLLIYTSLQNVLRRIFGNGVYILVKRETIPFLKTCRLW